MIDWGLIPAFLLSAYSGIELHVAGHGPEHATWHHWAIFHVLVSLAFLLLGILHVKMHWGWYTSYFKKGLGNKSRITLSLTILFVLVTLTGIALLEVEGANSGIGLWHYRIGLLVTLISTLHLAKRWPTLKKSWR